MHHHRIRICTSVSHAGLCPITSILVCRRTMACEIELNVQLSVLSSFSISDLAWELPVPPCSDRVLRCCMKNPFFVLVVHIAIKKWLETMHRSIREHRV